MNNSDTPKLRAVDAIPVTYEGRRMLLLRDPLRLTANDVCLPMEAAFLLQFFDGRRTVLDIKAEFTRQTGSFLYSEELERLIGLLDNCFLLENETFRNALGRLQEEFAQSGERHAFHAGTGYPEDPGELARLIEGFYGHPEAPRATEPKPKEHVRGFIAPHIDVRSGGPTFAAGYNALKNSASFPDLFIILGTGHQGLENLFACTRKTFVTPFGPVQTDSDFVDRLVSGLPVDLTREELAHRTEHVIEFQLIFLQHLYAGRHEFQIVPILCSFEPDCLLPRQSDGRAALFAQFVERLGMLIDRTEKRVCVIASVDLDHVGPRYGDSFRPDHGTITRHLTEDRELLDLLSAGHTEQFLKDVACKNARKKICGFSPIYTLMNVLPGVRGELLRLDHTVVDGRGSFVTYAAMAFYGA
ncbi:MAG: AmmeMemoRadiSam system protein B [Deltaproteobacteria bacterium]|nr:AmmeMemoRadiSam system protein B [Deltaproteobacteria bacterium]